MRKMTLEDYRERMLRAAGHLSLTNVPVISIAMRAGYETPEAFSRAFKTMTGRSPSQWRCARREAGWGPSPSSVHFGTSIRKLEFEPLTNGGDSMEVRIEKLEPQHVAFVRHVGPYEKAGVAWETLCRQLGPAGLLGPQTHLIGLNHDDPEVTPPQKLRYDACVPVAEDFVTAGEVGVQIIEGGSYAITTHKGPYSELKHTYATICGQWLPRHDKRFRDAPCFEVYLNDPQRTPAAELLTDVCIPIED